MEIVNTRTQFVVGLKFGLEEVPEQNDVKVTAGMRILCDGKVENGMSGSCRTHERDQKLMQCFR
jgi:cation transport ATPase